MHRHADADPFSTPAGPGPETPGALEGTMDVSAVTVLRNLQEFSFSSDGHDIVGLQVCANTLAQPPDLDPATSPDLDPATSPVVVEHACLPLQCCASLKPYRSHRRNLPMNLNAPSTFFQFVPKPCPYTSLTDWPIHGVGLITAPDAQALSALTQLTLLDIDFEEAPNGFDLGRPLPPSLVSLALMEHRGDVGCARRPHPPGSSPPCSAPIFHRTPSPALMEHRGDTERAP
jgi:hypothetical protein